jgi:putative transposase
MLLVKAPQIQRCQVHKIRNVVDHLTEEYQLHVRQKMHAAYGMLEYVDARRAAAQFLGHAETVNGESFFYLPRGSARRLDSSLSAHGVGGRGRTRSNIATR